MIVYTGQAFWIMLWKPTMIVLCLCRHIRWSKYNIKYFTRYWTDMFNSIKCLRFKKSRGTTREHLGEFDLSQQGIMNKRRDSKHQCFEFLGTVIIMCFSRFFQPSLIQKTQSHEFKFWGIQIIGNTAII